MARGRPPDPTRARTGAGNRPVPAPADAGGDPALVLTPPDDLTVPARAVWDGIVPWLLEHGVLAPSDAWLLVELCEAAGWARRYRQALDRLSAREADPALHAALAGLDDDELVEDLLEACTLGGQVAKRLRTAYLEALGRAESIASKFGLTPADRVRLGLMKRQGSASLLDAIARAMGTAPS